MKVILDRDQINKLLEEITGEILADIGQDARVALVGIRSRGEILAQRLQKMLQEKTNLPIDCGTLDITLYRDDLNQMSYQQPTVRATEIDFSIDDRVIILVDDVLNTGRTVRSALDALIDLGRPQAIRLAVLLDRGCRELPIRADYTGQTIDAPPDKKIHVYLQEMDDSEQVVLE